LILISTTDKQTTALSLSTPHECVLALLPPLYNRFLKALINADFCWDFATPRTDRRNDSLLASQRFSSGSLVIATVATLHRPHQPGKGGGHRMRIDGGGVLHTLTPEPSPTAGSRG
jgi:hypothetical protein